MVISSQETFICKTLNVIVIVYYFEIQKIKALKIQFIINFELINDVKRYILKSYFPLPKLDLRYFGIAQDFYFIINSVE